MYVCMYVYIYKIKYNIIYILQSRLDNNYHPFACRI